MAKVCTTVNGETGVNQQGGLNGPDMSVDFLSDLRDYVWSFYD